MLGVHDARLYSTFIYYDAAAVMWLRVCLDFMICYTYAGTLENSRICTTIIRSEKYTM